MSFKTVLIGHVLFWSAAAEAKAWRAAARSDPCETYALEPEDTCWSIMKNTNVTFAQIISWNLEINKQCSNLDELPDSNICISNPEGNYAIPSNSNGVPTIVTTTAPAPTPTPDETQGNCAEYHLVQAGEDCSDFVAKYEITKKDFLFLNPHVWENCTNVWLEYWYCVRPVGYISSYPGYLSPTSTREFVKTPSTKLPTIPDRITDIIGGNWKPKIPLAEGTRKDCLDYTYFSNLTDTPSLEDCWNVAWVWGISREEFVLWNPSLAEGHEVGTNSSDYAYPCTVSESSSYCVGLESPTSAPIGDDDAAPPSPRAAGEIENCTAWYLPRDWQTCENVLLNVELNIEQFFHMNPSVKSDCTGLTLGTYYCKSIEEDGGPPDSLPTPTTTSASATPTDTGISTPTPTQDGMVANCDEFYLVEVGDVCGEIANEHRISRADFDKWNPDVKKDCTGLIAEYYVCVGVDGAPPATTDDGGPKSTPTPTQSGMVDGCAKFHYVESGDGCWYVADTYDISLDSFYKWNPAVKDDCSGLLTEIYVCVGLE